MNELLEYLHWYVFPDLDVDKAEKILSAIKKVENDLEAKQQMLDAWISTAAGLDAQRERLLKEKCSDEFILKAYQQQSAKKLALEDEYILLQSKVEELTEELSNKENGAPWLEHPDWMEIRAKFFKECVEHTTNGRRISYAPHDLFEWFKEKLTSQMPPTAAREAEPNKKLHS